MPGFDGFLDLPPRPGKPRAEGLTHVIDKGMNLRDIEGLFDTAGEFVDIVKLGWGTSYVTEQPREEDRALPLVRDAGRLRRDALRGRLRARQARRVQALAHEHRFSHVEISDGTIEIPRERKLELIADFARDFTVLSEVGSKDAEVDFAPYQWVEWIKEELDAGAWKVITEGREGGTAGIYRPTGEMRTGLVDEIVHEIDVGDLIFEAPTKASPGLVRQAVRPERQPREHPARRGHPARDAPPRPARRHAEGGAARWRARPQLPDLDFEAMSAEDVLRWAYAEFGDRLCLTCSWQKQSSVLVHMVSELGLDLPVIELDTQLFFRETTRRATGSSSATALKLHPPPPLITVAEQHRREGPNLWETDPDRCCHIRKVEPLVRALEPYDAWISGIRRDQSPSRADDAEGRVVRALRRLEGPAARRLGREARLGVHPRQRDPVQPAARRGLPLDRLHPVHAADDAPTRRSAPAAGPAPTSSSAASTSTPPSGGT